MPTVNQSKRIAELELELEQLRRMREVVVRLLATLEELRGIPDDAARGRALREALETNRLVLLPGGGQKSGPNGQKSGR